MGKAMHKILACYKTWRSVPEHMTRMGTDFTNIQTLIKWVKCVSGKKSMSMVFLSVDGYDIVLDVAEWRQGNGLLNYQEQFN